ncbi:hemagglutinin repeat-containing protein, partial [Testudinibacter aquarius]
MNKHLYRLIFSKTQQRLVVVSEIATREGKAKGEGGQMAAEGVSRFTLGKGWRLSAVNVGLFSLLGLLFCATASANEMQIRADQSAPKNEQAIILQTANGVPQVNIQTPSAQGVSKNSYTQFDVANQGAILNNSRSNTPTLQGGWVQGNPYLATGEARVIVNQVNSADPSRLHGYVEVAGQRAEVIIANPSGIECQGCGTINAGRTTLTTGKVEMSNGDVNGFTVENGKVVVSGRGMDTSSSDYTDIIAREAEVNAGIWAKALKVTTGKNKVSRDNRSVEILHTGGNTEPNPTVAPQKMRYAVDVSELGGMYAGKIHLVGTEDGLGVRNAGHIGATQGNVQIDSQGQIVNTGFVGAQQDVKASAKQQLENRGTVYAQQGDVQLQSRTQGIQQHGSVIAKGNAQGKGKVRLQANGKIAQQGETFAEGDIGYQAKQIDTEKTAVLAAGVRFEQTDNGERKTLNAASENGKNLTLTAEQSAVAQGQNLASGKLQVKAKAVNLNHGQTKGYNIDIQASNGNVNADSAVLSAVKNLTINTPTTLSTQGSQLTAERIQTTQTDLFNQKGSWQQTGTDDFNLKVRHIQNQGGTLSTGGNFHLNADEVENTEGRLIAGQNLVINAVTKFNSARGTLFANNSLNLQTNQLTNTNGLIKSLGNMHINTNKGDISNQQTNISDSTPKGIIALGNLVINSATLNNTLGFIASNQNITINADTLRNDSGKLYAAQQAELQLNNGYYSTQGKLQADSLSISVPIIEQHQSNITVNKQLTIVGDSLVSADKSTVSANEINITLAKSLDHSESTILGNQSVTIDVQGGLHNSNSTIASRYHDLIIETNNTTLNNASGTLFAQEDLRLNSGSLNNNDGIIQAKLNAVLQTTELSNQNGVVMANNADIISGGINNVNGTLFTNTALNIISDALNNSAGMIDSQGELAINTQGAALNNLQGRIFSSNTRLNSGAINNQQGLLRGDKTLTIDTNNQHLDNQNTQQTNQGIIGLGSVVLNNINRLNNTLGKVAADQNLAINAQTLTNINGIINTQQQAVIQAEQIDNQMGAIWGTNTHLNATTINNQQGGQHGSLIGATDILNITATQLNNQQTVATGIKPTQGLQAKNIQLNIAELNNQQGGVYANNIVSATIKNQLNNQAGEFLAGQIVQIHALDNNLVVDNQEGTIEAGQQLNLSAKTLQNEGKIKTQGNAEIALSDSFTLNQAFQIGNNLVFSTQGDFVNNVKQVVGNQASFAANNLINNQNSEISSNHTLINANTVTNYGLLDGTQNIIKTDILNNLGSARIYGEHLAIQAESLNNLNNGEKSATIAARERLDLAVGTLINRDHSLIFSVGDIAIGGQLNEQNQATGYAKFVDNGSATIEALGNGEIRTERLLNHDLYLKLGEYHTDEHIIEYAPSNSSTRYALLNKNGGEGSFELKNNDKHDSNSYFILKDGTRIASRYWTNWDYNRHTVTSTIEYRDPAKILIGGDLLLSGSDLENNASTLSIGKTLVLGDRIFTRNENNSDLTADGVTLKNIDIQGTIDIMDTGRWSSFGKEYRRYGSLGKKRWAVYGNGSGNVNEIHPTQYFTFDKVLNEIGSEVTGTNTIIDNQSYADTVALKTITTSGLSTSVGQENIAAPTVNVVISGQTSTISPENLGNSVPPVIKTHVVEIILPQASLYQINPAAPNGYLVETDPQFANRRQWLSSDYMFTALRSDHNNMHKRLGDGFYEQRLINEQVNQLTGRRFLNNYQSDYDQYKALMDSGIKYAAQFGLIPGVALSEAQMKELTTDMVWLVNREVRLADGSVTTVLVPQVYIVARDTDVSSRGAVISANQIIANTRGDIENSGVIAGRQLTALSAENIRNLGGVLQGENVLLQAQNELLNLGGSWSADKKLVGVANTIRIESTLSETEDTGEFYKKGLNQLAKVRLNDRNGELILRSQDDITIKGANFDIAGKTAINAGNHLNLGTLTTENKEQYNANQDNYYRLHQTAEVGNQLNFNGDTILTGENGVAIRGNQIHGDGKLLVTSQGNIQIEEARQTEQLASASKTSSKSLLSKTTEIRKHDHDYNLAVGSQIDAKEILIQSKQGDVKVIGSDVVAEETMLIQGKNVSIVEAENRMKEENFSQTTKKGLMSSGGFGFTIGSRQTTLETDNRKYYSRGSQVGSLNGDMLVVAENDYLQRGSAVTSLAGDTQVQAKRIDITAADDRYETDQKYTFEQKGLTVAVNVPALQAVQSAVETVKNVGSSKNDRINAMGAANAAWDSYKAGKDLKALGEGLANGDMSAQNVSVSITYGEQKNVNQTHTEGNTANSSKLHAGGKALLITTGEKDTSHINIKGSDVAGLEGTVLQTAGKIAITAAEQHHQERSKNSSQGWNAGVAVSYGSDGFAFGVTAGGNLGRGYGNGDERSWVNSHVGLQESNTTIISGGDTNIVGGVVRGKGIHTDIGGDLAIASLQDSLQYTGKQQNIRGQVTVGYGVSGSASYNQSKMNADYVSVQEQSGLFAGDDGYQVTVKGHTELGGGLITSTAQAESEGKNRFRTGTIDYRDIENHANYSGSTLGVSSDFSVGGGESAKEIGGVKLASQGQNYARQEGDPNSGKGKTEVSMGIGFGSDSSRASDVTRSGINTRNIEITDSVAQQARTGKSAETVLSGVQTDITTESAVAHSGRVNNQFDKDALQKELDIQRTTTEGFGKTAAQGVAYTAERLGDVKAYELTEGVKAQAEQALKHETDPSKRAALKNKIAQADAYLEQNRANYTLWKEGGAGRTALHALAGGMLTGNVSGAVASGTTSAAAPHLNILGQELGDVGKAVLDIGAGMAIGAATGGGTAAVSAGGNTDWYNRQL